MGGKMPLPQHRHTLCSNEPATIGLRNMSLQFFSIAADKFCSPFPVPHNFICHTHVYTAYSTRCLCVTIGWFRGKYLSQFRCLASALSTTRHFTFIFIVAIHCRHRRRNIIYRLKSWHNFARLVAVADEDT